MGIRLFLGCLASACVASTSAFADCTLYQHRDYGGSYWDLGDGDRIIMVEGEDLGHTSSHCPECSYTIYYEASWNDQVSSFTVDAGCFITLWEHINEGGATFESGQSYRYVGGDWNDQASEAWCICD